LHFTSGKIFPLLSGAREVSCGTDTVGECAADAVDSAAAAGRFFYNAAHFQVHAADVMGLADLRAVSGVGDTKLARYGDAFLAALRD
jgi:hypothetical protein